MEHTKYLQELQEKLAFGKMSVMIGSGFSKNVSSAYPTWSELLNNLTIELYEKQFFREYNSLPSTSHKRLSRVQFVNQRIWEVLDEVGYLEIVSEFIRKKGIERMTTYIEEHIPFAKVEGNKLILEIKGKSIEIDALKLRLHREVVALPWNNIYTTNYDNLLELCVEEEKFDKLQAEITDLENEIDGISPNIKDTKLRLKDLEQTKKEPSPFDDVMRPAQNYQYPEETQKEMAELHNHLRHQERTINSIKNRIRQIKQKQANAFSIVIDAGKLRLKRNNNIIKLHGSLRSPANRVSHTFGFDGDHKKQYVICKEDYEGYPEKHEAFAQLMRISLLQESFCLIGFSANDPNFIAWISWVRDILQKHHVKDQKKEVKIYLIDTATGELSPDKLLFFENYSIKRIPITSPDVIELISQNGKVLNSKNIDDLLFSLLEYLGQHNDTRINVKIDDDVKNRADWDEIWKRDFRDQKTFKVDYEEISNALEKLRTFNRQFLLPDLKSSDFYGPERVLNFYDGLSDDDANAPQIKELVSYAIRECLTPASLSIGPEKLELITTNKKLDPSVATSITKNDLLKGNLDKKIKDSGKLEAYRLAFSFKFNELEKHLIDWSPENEDVLLKGGLLSLISPQKGFDYMSHQFETNFSLDSELKLYLLELANLSELSIRWRKSPKFAKQIEAYRRVNIKGVKDKFKKIIETARLDQRKKIIPYDNGRFSVSRNTDDQRLPHQSLSIEMLMVCIETGYNLGLEGVNNIDSRDWYPLFKSGFSYFPQAFLFYSLQIGDKDYIKRIAQDYSFDDHINSSERTQIVQHLLANVRFAPRSYQQKIFQFLGTFINSVPVEAWEKDFMKLWRQSKKSGIAFLPSYTNSFYQVATSAFANLQETKNIIEVLIDCVTNTNNHAYDTEYQQISVDFTYYLNKNAHLTRLKEGVPKVTAKIDSIIKDLTMDDHQIFVLANLEFLLTSDQKIHISKRLNKISYENIEDTRKFDLSTHFSRSLPDLQMKIKLAIINSNLLWHTGYKGFHESYQRRTYTVSTPIRISHLTRSAFRPTGLAWTNNEIKSLYERLKERIPELDERKPSQDDLFNYVDLSEELKWFIDTYSPLLINFEGFKEIQEFADELHQQETNYEQLIDGILGDQKYEVVWALSELSKGFYRGNAEKKLIQKVMDKVLLQAEPGLEATLSYLSAWVSSSQGKTFFLEGLEILEDILRKYLLCPLKGYDEAHIHECIIKIAQYLQHNSSENEMVGLWIERGRKSRFNNVRRRFFDIE